MSNKNAKVIIPTAIGAWVLFGVVFKSGTPPLVEVALGVGFFVGIAVMVFYLMAEEGWSTLAKRYKSATRFTGSWQPCATAQMAMVSVDDPEFLRNRLRLISTLRVGTTPDALHLSMLFSKIPLLGMFFPDVQIPWPAISKARSYDAPGWVTPAQEPGALLNISYDPNYRGTFVELEAGQPPVFIQLPEAIFGDALSRLPLA
ncbi:MAG TPA: hypothetical protein VJB57_16495 [Dehalococcoidia bacterium]|nr:hypothetical protein [Dehalococcoidia bacterium]